MIAELQSWSPRRWVTAAAAGVIVALLVGLPTDVIPNPVFGRPVPVTWWSYPVLVFTAVLGGILAATYVRDPELPANTGSAGAADDERIGCPVCNKLVVIALGTVGARRWFEPIQPLLAGLSLVLLLVALRARLRNSRACPIPAR